MKKLLLPLLIALITASSPGVVAADSASVDIEEYGFRNRGGVLMQNPEVRNEDQIEVMVGLKNNSANAARDVRLNVFLPFAMRVVADSIKIAGVAVSGNTSIGIFVGSMGKGERKEITFKAVPGGDMGGFYEIQAQVSGSNIGTIAAISTINILPKSTTSTPTPTPTPYPLPTISGSPTPSPSTIPTTIIKTKIVTKTVYVYQDRLDMDAVQVGRNVTEEQQVPTKQISAQPEDELEFSIQLTSNSDQLIKNIMIADVLPNEMDYIFNSARMNNHTVNDDLVNKGFAFGNLQPHEVKTVKYRVRVLPDPRFDRQEVELKNTVTITSENALPVTDTASIFVKAKNTNLLGGLLSPSGFGLYFVIFLMALVALFVTFWVQEKKKTRTTLSY